MVSKNSDSELQVTFGWVSVYCGEKEEVSAKECYLMVQRLTGLSPPWSLPRQEVHEQSGGGTQRLLHSALLALLTSLLYAARCRSSSPACIMIFILVASLHLVSPPYSPRVLYTSLLLIY